MSFGRRFFFSAVELVSKALPLSSQRRFWMSQAKNLKEQYYLKTSDYSDLLKADIHMVYLSEFVGQTPMVSKAYIQGKVQFETSAHVEPQVLMFWRNVLAATLYARVLVIEETAREGLYKRVMGFAVRLRVADAPVGFYDWTFTEDVRRQGVTARIEGRIWPPSLSPPPTADTYFDGSYVATLRGRGDSCLLWLDLPWELSKVLAPAAVLFCLSQVVADADIPHRFQLAHLLASVSRFYRERRAPLLADSFDSKAIEFALKEVRAATAPTHESSVVGRSELNTDRNQGTPAGVTMTNGHYRRRAEVRRAAFQWKFHAIYVALVAFAIVGAMYGSTWLGIVAVLLVAVVPWVWRLFKGSWL